MTTAHQWTPLAHLYPPGESQPFTLSYRGLQYEGEVLFAEEWNPLWGDALEGDIYFRIVFLRSRRAVPLDTLNDSRIAVCIPRRRNPSQRDALNRDLTAVRETMATYRTQRDAQSALILDSLDRQRGTLSEQLMEEGGRYASGLIYTQATLTESPSEIFSGGDAAAWFRRLAHSLLDWSYSSLPLRPSRLPRPLSPTDARKIYEAIFTSTDQEREPLVALGPALGLSQPHKPGTFDPTRSTPIKWIRQVLKRNKGVLPWKEAQTSLAHGYGLTHPFAILYLLAFVYHGQPEVEITLQPDHGLHLSRGIEIPGRRVTRDMILLLPWQDDLATRVTSLRLIQEVTWNDALMYTSLLCPGLEVLKEVTEPLPQEKVLLTRLGSIARDMARARGALASLRSHPPHTDEEVVVEESTLDRLNGVCGNKSFQEVYKTCRHYYSDPFGLSRDLEMLGFMLSLGECTNEIIEATRYLAGADVPASYPHLSLERMAVEGQLSLSVLLADSQAWPRIKSQFLNFKEHYTQAYLANHRQYCEQALSLNAAFEESRLKVQALKRLNSITQLGRKLSLKLDKGLQSFETPIKRCDLNLQPPVLDAKPTCESCGLVLGEELPNREVEQLLQELDRALARQTRRLGRLLVGRILHGPADQRLEDFLKIVLASDLTALSNTLDDELADFIRALLR